MLELFKFFRLGIVNVVGVTMPGVLFLLFAGVGFVLPLALFVVYFNQLLTSVPQERAWLMAGAAYRENKVALTALAVLVAYVIGYIIRLSSPDNLDLKSARESMRLIANDRKSMSPAPGATPAKDAKAAAAERKRAEEIAAKVDAGLQSGRYCDDVSRDDIIASEERRFPYRGERGNKFPYLNFKEYLENRGFADFTTLLPSEAGGEAAGSRAASPKDGKWTKTAVNMMKLKVRLQSPTLAAVIESNEAHIRLLSGTWQAINACQGVAIAGLALGSVGGLCNVLDAAWGPLQSPAPAPFVPPLLLRRHSPVRGDDVGAQEDRDDVSPPARARADAHRRMRLLRLPGGQGVADGRARRRGRGRRLKGDAGKVSCAASKAFVIVRVR